MKACRIEGCTERSVRYTDVTIAGERGFTLLCWRHYKRLVLKEQSKSEKDSRPLAEAIGEVPCGGASRCAVETKANQADGRHQPARSEQQRSKCTPFVQVTRRTAIDSSL